MRNVRAGAAAVAAAAATLVGCATHHGLPPPSRAASAPLAQPGRHPDGAWIDLEGATPPPVSHANAAGVVALREPLSDGAVVAFIDRFLEAWRHESIDELAALLSRGSGVGPIEGRARGREAVVEAWKTRLRAHARELARLGPAPVRRDRVAHYSWDELPAGRAFPAAEVREGETYVVAPLEAAGAGAERSLPEVVVLVLRVEPSGVRMVAYGEADLDARQDVK